MTIEYKPLSLADHVYERLEEAILTGEYKPGEILTEKKLAAELGVSRTPIREAMSRLIYDNLLTETTSGTEVRGISKSDVTDMYDVKRELEPMATYKAAKNMTDEDLEALKDVIDQQVYYAGKGEAVKVRNLDTEFHDIIYAGCGSLTFQNILSRVHHKLKKYRSNSLKNKDRIIQSVEEHQEIYDALKAKDADKAEKLMAKHLENAYKSIAKAKDE